MKAKMKTTAAKEEARPELAPKLRFPEFRGAKGWESREVNDLVDTVTPPKKLPTASYASSGAFPIIDQSQSDICGWTDDNEALIRDGLPLIVFGDHTCILKLASRPFAQGADGIKILKSRSKVGTPFLFQFLSHRPVVTEEYRRHYSILKERIVFFPEFKSGEQQKIVECLSSVDELMAAQARKVDALKTHKKGLMQQLFPREGETVPRLRFPEFQNAGDWEVATIGDLKPFVTSGSRGWAPFYAEQGELFVRITNLWRDSIYLDLTDSKFVQLPPGAKEGVRTQLREHDVLISITADIGVIGYVDENVPSPAYINQHIALVRFDSGQLCGKYVAYFLASEKSQRLFRASTDTGTKAGMSLIGIQKIQLMLPGLPEQHRIASCLSTLDGLITAETQKLAALKTHKKGLMQQLFPCPEGVEG
jgi:type I restriction enzyme S subunit